VIIDLQNLRVRKNGRVICAVDALAVQPGERLLILGGNGAGKTTLLRLIAGLETEYTGKCEVQVDPGQCVYVHQRPYLFRGSVLSNVLFGLRARRLTKPTAEPLALKVLEQLGIRQLAQRSVSRLSGGEIRRVALARALVLQPRLFLLDEPLAEMDDDGAATILQLLVDMRQATILIASPTDLPAHPLAAEYRSWQLGRSIPIAEQG